MKISRVSYTALANVGNYQNNRIEIEAILEEGDDYKTVLESLQMKVHQELRNEKQYHEYCQRHDEAKMKLKDISEQLRKAYEQWEETSNFLIAQGLKPSVPAFPIAKENLITASIEQIEPEFLEDIPY